ncbi:MAG: hypothetical protein KA100_00255 [Rickettsiales bacterium]|nr:hypothetical protein [Rickettsiales bacterium]
MKASQIKSGALFFAAIILFSFAGEYAVLLNKKENEAKKNAEKIYTTLSNNFDQSENILIAVGKKIIEETPELDPKAIHKIFVNASKTEACSNIFSWSLFDWVNINGFQVVTTALGIRKNPPQIALERNYLNRGVESWKIIFSEATLGIPSGMQVIPIGVQVESKKGGRVGAVGAGIDINKLSALTNQRLDANIDYLLVDQRSGGLTFGSQNLKKNSGKIFNRMPEELDGKKYVFEKKMGQKYPYIIWVGYDQKEFWREVFCSSFMLAIEIISIAACVSFLIKKSER